MPLCDIDEGLNLRIIEFLFTTSFYFAGLLERYDGYTIRKENNFHQYDGPATLASDNSYYSYGILVRIFYFYMVVRIVSVLALPLHKKVIPRLRVSTYKVYFPVSSYLDFLVLIVFLESNRNTDFIRIVLFVSIPSIYNFYKSEVTFIVRYLVYKLVIFFGRYGFLRVFLYGVALFSSAVLLVLSLKIGVQYVAYVWHLADQNNFITSEYCDDFKKISKIERNENSSGEIFATVSLKQYLLSSSDKTSFSLHFEESYTYDLPHSENQLPFFHEKHERTIHEDTEFTCSYRFICTNCLNKYETTIWSKDNSLFMNASENYKVTSTYLDIENSTWKASFSTLTLYDIKQSDYGEYRCLFRRWRRYTDVLEVESIVIGRYHLAPRETEVIFVHVPLGNSIYVQWCPLHINEKSEDVEHTHFVDDRAITGSHEKTGNKCSAFPYVYHLISYYSGWIDIPHPGNTDVPSYKVTFGFGFIGVWLHTCANMNVYGRHEISLIREIYNKNINRTQLVEVKHPTEKIILPKTPYIYSYDNKTLLNNTFNTIRASFGYTTSDSVVLALRIIMELIILLFVSLFIIPGCISRGWRLYRSLIISPMRHMILAEPKQAIDEQKKFTVAIFCSERDSTYWDSTIIQVIEKMTDTKVLFIHRDMEHFAGRTVFEIYSELYKQTNAVIIHLTKSFIEDKECLHFHMYSPLTLVKEGQLPPGNILLIHGDTCLLPDSINYTIPDVVVHEWIQTMDKEDRIQKIEKWINIVKSQKCIKGNPNSSCVSSFIL